MVISVACSLWQRENYMRNTMTVNVKFTLISRPVAFFNAEKRWVLTVAMQCSHKTETTKSYISLFTISLHRRLNRNEWRLEIVALDDKQKFIGEYIDQNARIIFGRDLIRHLTQFTSSQLRPIEDSDSKFRSNSRSTSLSGSRNAAMADRWTAK